MGSIPPAGTNFQQVRAKFPIPQEFARYPNRGIPTVGVDAYVLSDATMNHSRNLFKFLAPESQPGDEPIYDIFSGTPEENAVWLEAVVGAGNARDRLEEIAERERSGHLFVYCRVDHRVVYETFWN